MTPNYFGKDSVDDNEIEHENRYYVYVFILIKLRN